MDELSSSSEDLQLNQIKHSLSLGNENNDFSSGSSGEETFDPVVWKRSDLTGDAIELDIVDIDNKGEPKPSGSRFDESDLEDGANTIMEILIPVCITMAIVIMIVKLVSFPMGNAVSVAMVYREEATDTGFTKFFGALLNAALFVVMIVIVTCVFVALYYYRCMQVIFGWLILSTGMMLGVMGGYLFYEILNTLNIPMDYITFFFLLWNFTVCGILSIFWYSPLKVNQTYLIFISAVMAILFTRFPEWTTWALLAAIAIYDLFAVLCPKGPLRVLVETAQERNETIPALIYSASIFMMMAGESSSEEDYKKIKNNKNNNNNNQIEMESNSDDGEPLEERNGEEGEEIEGERKVAADPDEDMPSQRRGVKLGLGDFVFYSVLVGRAALFDMLTVFTSFVGIVTGLFCTILLLAVWKKALPALPISIFFGMIFYFWTKFSLISFMSDFTLNGVTI